MTTPMNDNELDRLFDESGKRQRAMKNVNRQVMRTVRRDLRRKRLLKWARLLGISFGAPIALVLYVYMLYTFMPELPEQLRIACFVLPVGTIAILLARKLHGFSVADM